MQETRGTPTAAAPPPTHGPSLAVDPAEEVGMGREAVEAMDTEEVGGLPENTMGVTWLYATWACC